MKILGIDTTTKFLCLGIYDDSKVYEYNMDLGKVQSSLLVPTIKRVLDALGWSIGDIDYFACGLGPGSFTGVRVGVATIKGFAWSLNKPVLGISTLDILAKNINPVRNTTQISAKTIVSNGVKINDKFIVPIIDAKRNLIYSSIYKAKRGTLKRIMPYMLLTKDEFFKKAKPHSIVLGDAVGLYKEDILKNIKGVNLLDKDYWYPKAHNIISLALGKIKAKNWDNAFDIRPIYLYPKECQIRK